MKRGAQTAAAVIAGYLLGRTKKMRLALMIAAAGATGKHGTNPAGLLRAGLSRLGESAELGKLTESVRGELLDSARAAATKAATSRVESLTQRLSGDSDGQKEADGETDGEERDTGGGEAPSEDGEDRTGRAAPSRDGEDRTRKPSARKRSRASGGEDEAGPRGRRATSAAGSRRPARKRAESSAASGSAGESGAGGDEDHPRTRARSSAGRSPVRRTGR
ncbi:hypothetical protein [Saccharomonospora xinjiangensis]|uniref:Uncharacterized protein n=1 Tax=Saccharomonospora xinjiangensis XJ-54 TaxID=882086 RepID=I0UX37_9PSEU|nr:hypothetical protein [Saccharomonospora xinjiangensis]EID52440.1 hypothetical protein SacxiDRAFT_0158 [Saccharomonospora xinjiangensis XJ-54]